MTTPRLTAASDSQLAGQFVNTVERSDFPLGPWALVVDADRTLAAADTGRLVGDTFGLNQRIRAVFETHGYSAEAFASVSELWSDIPIDRYLAQTELVADMVCMFTGWTDVFSVVADRLPVIVVTSGIPQIWRRVLDRYGFPGIPVFGGCHASVDQYLVDTRTKRRAVELLQLSGRRVIAAGDSLIDEAMLRQADISLIVPDHNGSAPLRDALAGLPHVRLFRHDQRQFGDFPHIIPSALVDLVFS